MGVREEFMAKEQILLADWFPLQGDRNREKGGRSFYFFDLDDNILHLTTPIVLFHKESGEALEISSGELSSEGHDVGKSGRFADYIFVDDDQTGSFKYFRDQKCPRKSQPFVHDIRKTIKRSEWIWKGPSWNSFYYAVVNRRPVSIITARGHSRPTMREGIKELVRADYLPRNPNYLCIFPVSNRETREFLGDRSLNKSIAELKKRAIEESVAAAFKKYGYNPYHRFGMSDDDPKNLKLITEAMTSLKMQYPEIAFFVIDTGRDPLVKTEIFEDHLKDTELSKEGNINPYLFDF